MALAQIVYPALLRPNGQLFMTTPFTWLESFTPKEHWLGTNAEDSFSGLRDGT